MDSEHGKYIFDLCKDLVLLETPEDFKSFLKDLCTPREIDALAERWRICKLLDGGNLSYREISKKTKASLTTIGRVARFLKNESNYGYVMLLKKLKFK